MTNRTQTGKVSLMDIPIKDNPRVYFKARNASYCPEIYIPSDQKEVLDHLKANAEKYYAAILPGIKICGSGIPEAIGELAKNIELVLAYDCCAPERGRLSWREYGKDKRRIEFIHYTPTLYKSGCSLTEEEIGDHSLREVLGWYNDDLSGEALKRREEVMVRLEQFPV